MDRTACWLVTAWIGLGVATATLRFVHADEPTDKQIPAQEYVRFAARHKGDSARGRAFSPMRSDSIAPDAIAHAARVAISARTFPTSAASSTGPC